MCGRYRLSRRAEILASYFSAEYEGLDWEARRQHRANPNRRGHNGFDEIISESSDGSIR